MLGKVLNCTGMIRYISDGGGKLEAELSALCVCLGQLVKIVEDCGHEVVNCILGDIVPCENDCCDCDGVNIVGSAVDILLDGVGAVVGAICDELIGVLLVEADEVNLAAGAQVGAPATTNAASILPSFRPSAESPKSRY